jgi:hypothetical protein
VPRGQRPYLKRSKVPLFPQRGFSESVMGEGSTKKPVKMFKPLAAVSTSTPPKPATEREAYLAHAEEEAEFGPEELRRRRKRAQQHRPD